MLTRLKLKNFKSVGDRGVDLELKPLTVLVGENGSGKSTILEAVAILPPNAGQFEFRFSGELVQFSSYEEIAHRHEINRWITWEIHLPGGMGVRLERKPDSGEEQETVVMDGQDYVRLYTEGNLREGLKLMAAIQGQPPIGLKSHALVTLHGEFLLAQFRDYGVRDQYQAAADVLDKVAAVLKEKVFLLSGLRGRVPAQASTAEPRRWVGVNGEGVLPLLSLISSTRLYEDQWVRIQKWAKDFGLGKLKAGYRGQNLLAADYEDAKLVTPVNLAFAGHGSRQIISVITQLFWAAPDSLIMIEEPEISLHPESQVKLGALFADAIKEGKQIMISTHSHFLLLALSKAVESGLRADDIAVYHVAKGKEGTVAASVRLNNRGYPLRWPSSYQKVELETALRWAKGLAKK